ncbi:hypothetical protein [Bradyrhizobium sp. SRS-191]|uniref:hypothetical protein n=1 Tax=Bradyrhizobium sp. SRS-191 TaxID=2962606 RepID=UPI00211F1500|nr:hypothetical protein [Bradyrhizobium sp. SRS-191]
MKISHLTGIAARRPAPQAGGLIASVSANKTERRPGCWRAKAGLPIASLNGASNFFFTIRQGEATGDETLSIQSKIALLVVSKGGKNGSKGGRNGYELRHFQSFFRRIGASSCQVERVSSSAPA